MPSGSRFRTRRPYRGSGAYPLRRVESSHKDLHAQAAPVFVGICTLQKQCNGFFEVGHTLFDCHSLARHIKFWTEGHIHVPLFFHDGRVAMGRQRGPPFHRSGSGAYPARPTCSHWRREDTSCAGGLLSVFRPQEHCRPAQSSSSSPLGIGSTFPLDADSSSIRLFETRIAKGKA